MRIIDVNNNKFIDQELYDYINNIWLTYDIEIPNDSNIFFAKNTTVNRLISDYSNKGYQRVIKKEKAEYVIINKIHITNYPQYYDAVNNTITQNDLNNEVVYAIYNNSSEAQDVIELILDFIIKKQEVKYVNQDKLNDSLNNGFVIDKESYITLKELIDSPYSDNHVLAVNMLVNSELKSNWEWLIYLYHNKYSQLYDHDKKKIITNYFSTLNLGTNLSNLTSNIDLSLSVIKDEEVKNRFINLVRQKFNDQISSYFKTIGTSKFNLNDFKITYNE